jgi:hypothetical protein
MTAAHLVLGLIVVCAPGMGLVVFGLLTTLVRQAHRG